MKIITPTNLSFIIIFCFSLNLLLITASLGASELAILQSFKEQSKSIDGGTGLSDWDIINSSTHYCNWGGVICSSNGSITNLDFQSRGLMSPLPTIICTLPNLVELNLFNNSYSEEFPVGLFNCTKSLSILNLSYNNFYGTLPNDPNTWSNLSSLTSLDLGSNSFMGQFPPTIGDDLLSLEYLSTWNNNFNGFIPPSLGNLSHLKNLSIAWNNYTYAPLPQELSKLSELSWLYCAAWLRGSSRLCGVVLHGFVASSRFFADFLSAVRPITVRPILPLKPVVKAWSLGLLFGRYLHREGILMDHIVVVGVPSDLGLHL